MKPTLPHSPPHLPPHLPPQLGRRAFCLLGATLLLPGCGFRLRGRHGFAFSSLYPGLPVQSDLGAALRRQLEAHGVRVFPTPEGAEVRLEILRNEQEKDVLSITAAGKVREHELRRRLRFRVVDAHGAELQPSAEIIVRRTLTYDEAQVLSKEYEERMLFTSMLDELVEQLLRRLGSLKPAA